MKVFSVYKFMEDCFETGDTDGEILRSLNLWAERCHGLTENEMKKLGLETDDDWMEEEEE